MDNLVTAIASFTLGQNQIKGVASSSVAEYFTYISLYGVYTFPLHCPFFPFLFALPLPVY